MKYNLEQNDYNAKSKYVQLYQIYDSTGNKIYEPFFCQESAEYMMQYSDISGQVIEIEIQLSELLNGKNAKNRSII